MAAQRAAQRMVHALAEIAAGLCSRVRKQGVALRQVQLDRSAARLARGAHGVSNEARVQAGGARRAEDRCEACLHAAGDRRTREYDD